MSALPPGFVLEEEAPASGSGLPPGFVMEDAPPAPPAISAPTPVATPTGLRGGKVDALVTGARDPIDAGAQLLPRGLSYLTSLGGTVPNRLSGFFDSEAQRVDQMVQGNDAEYQAARAAQGREGFDAMRLAGNVMSPANLAVGARAAAATRGLGVVPRIAASVPVGAAYGLSQPVLDPEADFAATKAQQALVGAAVGPAAEVGGMALGRVIAPKTSAEARQLLDEGVTLTPGQIMGGAARDFEDKLTSVPILGGRISAAKQRGVESFNVAAANRALGPIGQKVPESVKAGRDLIGHVEGTLGKEYDRVLQGVSIVPDQAFMQDITQIRQLADELPAAQRDQFVAIMRNKLATRLKGGSMDGPTFKEAQSELSRLARGYAGDQDLDKRLLGDLLEDVGDSLRGALERSNPAKAAELSKVNKGWANFVRLQRATAMLGAKEGVATPAQLQNAVKAADSSVRKGRFARGDALMQDLSETGATVMGTYPNSGTAGRLLAGTLALGGAGAINPLAFGAAGLGTLAYTQPGQYVLRAAMTGAPQQRNALAQAVTQYGPVTALPGALPLLPIGSQ